MLDDFRLRVFTELAESGSFTLVSHKLGISQPAVSQNIAFLEQAIGSPLFVRARGQVTLTEKGENLLMYARKIQYWYKRIDSELVRGEKPESQPVILDLARDIQAEVSVEEGAVKIKLQK